MNFYAELVLNITFISIFIGVFYFMYVIKVEKDMIKSQAKLIAREFADIVKILPDNLLAPLKNTLSVKESESTELSPSQIANNNKLQQKTYDTLLFVFIAGVLVSYLICDKMNHKYSDYIIHSLIIVLFVGLTEYSFLQLVIKNYISSDPNYIKYLVFKNLNEKINE